MSKSFYITTPIYYATDAPHLGSAYTTVAADCYQRFKQKFDHQDTYLLTGTDEHGAKVAEAAANSSLSEQKYVDTQAAHFKQAWHALGIEYSRFVRTTDATHIQKVEQFSSQLWEKKFIYKGKYLGLYCQGCEEYKTEGELIEGLCPLHHSKPQKLSEECYFFALSNTQFKAPLIAWVNSAVYPISRRNELLAFIDSGLKDVAVTRASVKWGIDVPWDKKHTLYVWIDALLNYWTNADEHWPPDLQLIGKDILRFHGVIWPAMLLAYYDFDASKLPKKLFVHGFFTVSGQKMSKSLGNKIDPLELATAHGQDALRYYLLAEVPFGADGDVSIKAFRERYNADLANTIGNLVQRVLTMIGKYGCQEAESEYDAGEQEIIQGVKDAYRELAFHKSLEQIVAFARAQNVFIDQTKPWQQAQDDTLGVQKNLGLLKKRLLIIAELLTPVMPEAARQIEAQLQAKDAPKPIFPKILEN